jgi:hypothetical protein
LRNCSVVPPTWHREKCEVLQLPPLAIGAFAVLVVAAVLALCGNDEPGRGWGWSALLLLTALGVLIVVSPT